MTESEIEQKVRDAVADKLNLDANAISREQEIVRDLGADSLDLVEICEVLEAQFADFLGGEIPEEAASKFKTIGDVTDYLKVRVGI
jgi:acyl carrier protein